MNGLRKPTNLMRTRRAVFLCPDYSMQPSEIPSESARVKMSGARFPGRGDEGGLVPRYFPAEARRRIVRNGRGNRKKILRGRKTKRSCCINSRKRRNATARLLFRADSCPFSSLSEEPVQQAEPKSTKKRNSFKVLGVPRSESSRSARISGPRVRALQQFAERTATPTPPFEKGGRKLLGLFATGPRKLLS